MLSDLHDNFPSATGAADESAVHEEARLLDSVSPDVALAAAKRLAGRNGSRVVSESSLAAEMAIARRVQSHLFPHCMPPLQTLDYAANCEEASAIGGDYYDFLDIGRGRVGLLLADVSGKGISAALLMASLQASLRSQRALAPADLAAFFRTVNRLFCESVTEGFYATLFFVDYSDARRSLRYVNCGHHPAILIHADGWDEMLGSTATVLGFSDKWDCVVGHAEMSPGDILVMYSDGVTEAQNPSGEFFGEERLIRAVRANSKKPAADILRVVADSVRQFGGDVQEDDLTLVVARAR